MRRFLIAFAFLITSVIIAQRGTQEVSFDVADALIMKTLELNYEFYLDDKKSAGISGLFNFEKKSSDFRYNEDSMITPYFRYYLTTHKKWNYFAEIFMGINSGEAEYKDEEEIKIKEYTDGALGVSIGLKYITEGGISLIAIGGVGRNMFGEIAPLVVPRVGLSLGYRF